VPFGFLRKGRRHSAVINSRKYARGKAQETKTGGKPRLEKKRLRNDQEVKGFVIKKNTLDYYKKIKRKRTKPGFRVGES